MNHVASQSAGNQAYRNTVKPIPTQDAAKQQGTATDDILKTGGQASRQLGVSVQTLANWAWKKYPKLPLVKVGRSVRYRQSDIEAFIAANRYGSNQCDTSGGTNAY